MPHYRLAYINGRFVDRTDEIDAVLANITLLRQGITTERWRVIRFQGTIGSGKSWLLRRLQVVVCSQYPDTIVTRLCLIADPDIFDRDPGYRTYVPSTPRPAISGLIVSETLTWLVQQAIDARGATPFLPSTTDPQALSVRLNNELDLTGQPLVLLVDGLDELAPDLVELMQQYCLSPLISRGDTLLVLGLRVPLTGCNWISEITSHSEENPMVLKPFTKADTSRQFAQANDPTVPLQAQEMLDEIVEQGGGQPGTNLVLAQHVDANGNWNNKRVAFQDAVNSKLGSVDQTLCDFLRAACILRGIHELSLRTMAEAYGILPFLWETYPQRTKVLRGLTRARLVRPNEPDVIPFVMDDDLRTCLDSELHLTNLELWRHLHEAAVSLYEDWEARHQSGAGRWRQEKEYHQACLDAGKPVPYTTIVK